VGGGPAGGVSRSSAMGNNKKEKEAEGPTASSEARAVEEEGSAGETKIKASRGEAEGPRAVSSEARAVEEGASAGETKIKASGGEAESRRAASSAAGGGGAEKGGGGEKEKGNKAAENGYAQDTGNIYVYMYICV
jgi:hypothetical protein